MNLIAQQRRIPFFHCISLQCMDIHLMNTSFLIHSFQNLNPKPNRLYSDKRFAHMAAITRKYWLIIFHSQYFFKSLKKICRFQLAFPSWRINFYIWRIGFRIEYHVFLATSMIVFANYIYRSIIPVTSADIMGWRSFPTISSSSVI